MFASDFRTIFVFLLAFILLKINAFPAHHRSESVSPIMQPLYDFFEQTKNFGQQIVQGVSDFSSSVVDYVSEFFAQAKQETDDFFNKGGELIDDSIKGVRNFGQRRVDEGIGEIQKIVQHETTSLFDAGWNRFTNNLNPMNWWD